MQVRDVEPGTIFVESTTGGTVIFLDANPHFLSRYRDKGFWVVMWVLPDRTLSFDCLSPEQDVGEPFEEGNSREDRNNRLENFLFKGTVAWSKDV